jgi:hypothetical protein
MSLWHHVALVRYGNILTLYIDGIGQNTTANVNGVNVNSSSGNLSIGRPGDYNGYYFNGWIDEFRFSNGIARWTSNFTPPASAYTNSIGSSGSWLFLAQVPDNTTTTYIDNIPDTNLQQSTPTADTTNSRPVFPRGDNRMGYEADVPYNITQTFTTSQLFNGYWSSSSPVNNDTADWQFWVENGADYSINITGATRTSNGLIDWYLDNVLIASGQDWYAASTTYNVQKTITPVNVVGSGYHVLRAYINGKNGSSSGYGWSITSISMYRPKLY